MENSMEFPEKTKQIGHVIQQTPPGHISRQNSICKGYLHPYVHISTVYNTQDMGTT